MGSWRPVGQWQHLPGFPGSHPAHDFATVRAERRASAGRNLRGVSGVRRFVIGPVELRIVGRLPGVLFCGCEHGGLAEQGADAVAAHLGGGMEPAETAHAGKIGRQDVLEEAAQPVEGVELNGGVAAGLAVAVGPADFALGQQGHGVIIGGGLEDVAGEICALTVRISVDTMLFVMGRKSRLKKLRRDGVADGPLMWASEEGVHALEHGQPPTTAQVAAMTLAYQERIRKSPLWNQMVKEFGEQKAAEMLKEFTVKIDEGA